MDKEIKIVLNLADYQCLVSGGQLTIKDTEKNTTIKIILSDVGFYYLHQVIDKVEAEEIKHYSNLTRDN